MELTERKTIPAGDWTWEIKYDGYRMLASTGPGAQVKREGGGSPRAFQT